MLRGAQESTGSGGLGRETPNYGKFYKIAYMDLKDGYKRGPSINAAVSDKNPQHFHRPGKLTSSLRQCCSKVDLWLKYRIFAQ
jgi:hypothetical protein